MRFNVVVAIVPEDLEQRCIDRAREVGAGGMTVIPARGIGHSTHKTFFGLSYDGAQSVLLMVLEHQLSLEIMDAFTPLLRDEEQDNSRGLIFSLPLDRLRGMDLEQIQQFEQHLKQEP